MVMSRRRELELEGRLTHRFGDILLVPHLQLRPSIAPPLIGMPVPHAADPYRASGSVR
jgi:hypothetical protein